MSRIQLTYGNSALAWGRDQARSAKALASEGERAARVLGVSAQTASIANGTTASANGGVRAQAPAPSAFEAAVASASASSSATGGAAASLAATATGAAGSTQKSTSGGDRFARLLADIANANTDLSESEMAAQGVPLEVATAHAAQTGSQSSVAMHNVADRSRYSSVLTASLATPQSVAALAQEILATQREGDAMQRRSQLEDRARHIGLSSQRQPAHASPQLSVAYDQVGYVATPRAQLDRKG